MIFGWFVIRFPDFAKIDQPDLVMQSPPGLRSPTALGYSTELAEKAGSRSNEQGRTHLDDGSAFRRLRLPQIAFHLLPNLGIFARYKAIARASWGITGYRAARVWTCRREARYLDSLFDCPTLLA